MPCSAREDGRRPASGFRELRALNVLFGKRHRRIEADNREVARHVQDGLNDGLAHFGFEIVQLGGIVPGHRSAIVAMIDVAHVARPAVNAV